MKYVLLNKDLMLQLWYLYHQIKIEVHEEGSKIIVKSRLISSDRYKMYTMTLCFICALELIK